MKENVRLVFEALISKLNSKEDVGAINIDYKKSDDIYRCWVISEFGEIVFDGYAWISNGVVLTKEATEVRKYVKG